MRQGRVGPVIEPESLKASAISGKRREMLLDLASDWTGIQSDAVAKAKMDEMRKNITGTWFARSGSAVVVEYAPETPGGDPANPIRTICRHSTNDQGAQWRES